jgi:hypothetical protein
MYVVEKKSQGGLFYNIKLLSKIFKYSYYIYSFSIKHDHAHEAVVNNGGCITSHNKRGEQAFYTKYTGK